MKKLLLACILMCSTAAFAQGTTGVTDTEVKLGQTMPYSGPGSAYGIIGKTDVAFFAKVNDEGGIHGRKINLISKDDGYNPAKTVEMTRQMVERDGVLGIFGTIGTAPNSAILQYLNQKKVPHIIAAGASKFADPSTAPYTISFYPSYEGEGETLAKYALMQMADAKIAIIYQNDDSGRDYVKGFKRGLGDKASNVVAEVSYDLTEPTVNSQVSEMQSSGAMVVFNASTPKFAGQIIRRMGELQWRPLHLLTSPSTSIDAALKPGGLDNAKGIVSSAFLKTPSQAQWENDSDVKEFKAFIEKYLPEAKVSDFNVAYGYMTSAIMKAILEQAGRDLSRESLIKAATNMPETEIPLLLPGLTVSSAPNDYLTFNTLRLQRFDGEQWVILDEIVK